MAFVLDPEVVHRTAALLDDAGLDLDDLLPVPSADTGTTCDRTEAGLATVTSRSRALAARLAVQADQLRWLAPFTAWVDDDVAARFTRGTGR